MRFQQAAGHTLLAATMSSRKGTVPNMSGFPPLTASVADGVFIGLDWGGSFHQMCVLDPLGRVVSQGRFAHDVGGLEKLDDQLSGCGPVAGIAIERGDGLLVERLQHNGYRLYCVSPKMSARARERYRMAPVKSDAFDAFVLADSLRHEHSHWRPMAVPSVLHGDL